MERITPKLEAECSLTEIPDCSMDSCGNQGMHKILGKWFCSFHFSTAFFKGPQKRHRSSARFHEILKGIGELHDKKAADYGTSADPLANVRASKDWGMPAWVGATMRADDKMKRLKAFVANGKLENESVVDSMIDLAAYAIIALVLYEEEHTQ